MPLQAGGEFALVKENLELALELPGQPVKRGTMAHQHIVYMMLAEAAAQMADVTVLRRYAAQLEKLALREDHQPYLAIAHRALGIACRFDGQYADAGDRLQKALAIFEKLETHWQIGCTLYEMAQLNLAQSNPARAMDDFSRALVEFESLRAIPDIRRTKEALQMIV